MLQAAFEERDRKSLICRFQGLIPHNPVILIILVWKLSLDPNTVSIGISATYKTA